MTPRHHRRHWGEEEKGEEEKGEEEEERADYTEGNGEMLFQGVIAERYLNMLYMAF